jgi:hypothetical protein
MPEQELVERYVQATQAQQSALRGGTEEVDIDASVPKFKKQGKLHALKNISKLGKITYHALGFSGDSIVKTEVIANYLKAEVESAEGKSNLSITPENYKFKYKGTWNWKGREVYVLHLSPREKKVGLFKGELWLDTETYTRAGFVCKVAFVHVEENAVRAGLRTPERSFHSAAY